MVDTLNSQNLNSSRGVCIRHHAEPRLLFVNHDESDLSALDGGGGEGVELGAHYAIFDRWDQIRVAQALRGSLVQITLGILLGLIENRPA